MAGCLEGIKRANSANLAGWVEGPVTKLKSGRRQVEIKDGKVYCFIVGMDDIVLTKNDVASFECVAQGTPITEGNKNIVCNTYAVSLKTGEYGSFLIAIAKAGEFMMIMKP